MKCLCDLTRGITVNARASGKIYNQITKEAGKPDDISSLSKGLYLINCQP